MVASPQTPPTDTTTHTFADLSIDLSPSSSPCEHCGRRLDYDSDIPEVKFNSRPRNPTSFGSFDLDLSVRDDFSQLDDIFYNSLEPNDNDACSLDSERTAVFSDGEGHYLDKSQELVANEDAADGKGDDPVPVQDDGSHGSDDVRIVPEGGPIVEDDQGEESELGASESSSPSEVGDNDDSASMVSEAYTPSDYARDHHISISSAYPASPVASFHFNGWLRTSEPHAPVFKDNSSDSKHRPMDVAEGLYLTGASTYECDDPDCETCRKLGVAGDRKRTGAVRHGLGWVRRLFRKGASKES
ncbi:hypothetical protein JAAARDRAFT_33145 [Jaapia argillacea MUCL 33604]|uniref:Uncharacterized protein n=1 Tax=Jaapia argillacea MUCL 33604 TaxID=933084 RepID=A0A067PXZ6_9AGAM|nr:hypothetical protein JAAARDRAFT_33145 [Jaapia argillacea MUCL 33604]